MSISSTCVQYRHFTGLHDIRVVVNYLEGTSNAWLAEPDDNGPSPFWLVENIRMWKECVHVHGGF